MTIAEMHIMFRQYAQQMGMQNVRAILPEQIDLLINQSITDTVNQLIRENIGITNDRVVTDNSKIGQINAFRTLYTVKEVKIGITTGTTPTSALPFVYKEENKLRGLITHTYTAASQTDSSDAVFGDYMFLVDMSINYWTGTTTTPGNDSIITNWYPVRIIDSAYLADTLNDFVLKNRFRSPIACVYNNDTLELYIDVFNEMNLTTHAPRLNVGGVSLNPYMLRIDLIKYPNKVKYLDDISSSSNKSVNCDLPESMHGDIVKHAVDMYRIAINGSLQASQEAEQAQQRENVRNNYRNEGNNQ